MSDPSTLDPATLKFLIEIASGFEEAKFYSLSSFVVLIYDHLTCLDQEADYFWKTGWSFTKALYFLNRLIPLMMFSFSQSWSTSRLYFVFMHSTGIKSVLSLDVVGMIVVEGAWYSHTILIAILAARVYHLWSHSWSVQIGTLLIFGSCISVGIVYAGLAIHGLKGAYLPAWLNQPGCINSGHATIWPIFLPLFILEAILFAATITRVLRPLRSGKSKPVAARLFRDGVLFFLVAFISISSTAAKSLMTSSPKVYLPALLSNAFYATHSICASHLILSIHSLAADLGSDPNFLLSNVEISRIGARRGANANELVVNCRSETDSPVELSDLDPLFYEADVIRVTRSPGPSASVGGLFDQTPRSSLGPSYRRYGQR